MNTLHQELEEQGVSIKPSPNWTPSLASSIPYYVEWVAFYGRRVGKLESEDLEVN